MSVGKTQIQQKEKGHTDASHYMTKERFLLEYANKEDGYKYEWNDGLVEKTKTMNQSQAKFYYILLNLFLKTEAAQKGGMLITETDMDTTDAQLRRPDIAFYDVKQLPLMWEGKNQVAPFVIEVISPNDKAEEINKKLDEYFHAGVLVVWHIFPQSKRIDVYTSPDNITICREETLCSAAPAIPDLAVSAGTFFA